MTRVTIKDLQLQITRLEESRDLYRDQKYDLERKLERRDTKEACAAEEQKSVTAADFRGRYEGFREATILFLESDEVQKIHAEADMEAQLDQIKNRRW